MKIDYLENASVECPLIRIYGEDPGVCRQLQRAFELLAGERTEEISLTDLPGVQPLGGCRLISQAGRRDQGIVRIGASEFRWVLTPATWDNVAGLMGPFCELKSGGYQWLDQVPSGAARVLISTLDSGRW